MLKFVYDNSSRVGPYLFIYTNKKVYYLTSFTVVRRLNFPLMRSPKESPTAPAANAAVMGPECLFCGGEFAADWTNF